jgi:hypothetical protein
MGGEGGEHEQPLRCDPNPHPAKALDVAGGVWLMVVGGIVRRHGVVS